MMTMPIMKENEFSPFGKAVVVVGIVAAAVAALINIFRGEPQNPFAFGIIGVGFVLFLIAKLSVVTRKQWISFGTKLMSPGMANAYRVGYWLIVVGILATFL
jgi:hypothetical protein